MKQIGSPTTLGAHGFKGRRRVGLRPTSKYLRRTQSPQARKKPPAPSVISDDGPTRYRYSVLLHLSSRIAIIGVNEVAKVEITFC